MVNLSLEKFQRDLGIKFKDLSLLRQALTHRSADKRNNERLEFLGDAILGMVIAEILFKMLPNVDEGGLSRYRSSLVRKETLAEIAREYGFSEVIILGVGELRSGGARHDSILADAFEAVLGALFLEQGDTIAKDFLKNVYRERLNNLPSLDSLKDYKTRLQEWLQNRKMALPTYEIISETTVHPQSFEIKCSISELDISVIDRASSRRKAEQKTAEIIFNKVVS